jgi:putative membrane protein
MDRPLFTRLIGDPFLSSVAIYLKPGADPEVIRRRILEALPGREDLLLLANRALKARALDIFDQTFAITYALEFIALVVAALGILNALVRPILIFLTLPITLLTLGLFTLVINALLFWFVSTLVKGFHVSGFGAAFWGALVLWAFSWITNALLRAD